METEWPEIKVLCQYITGEGQRKYNWYVECEGVIDESQWDMIKAISQCVSEFNKKEELKCTKENQ